MGNKIGRRRQVVDEKYTRPQGLYQHRDIDHKKLRKLILDSKLAPCYPGDEECAMDLEECPICFLYYPSLNRSRCCMKGICTECFLQMKAPHSTRPTQCPFCKTSNYAVEYRGMKTKEEKGTEQMEEQRVIEAQIRMQQQELQDEAQRMKKRQDVSSSSRIMTPAGVEYQDICSTSLSGNESVSSQASCSSPESTRPSHSRQNWDDNFDLDLEDIMVMEAIWLSIQEKRALGNPTLGSNVLHEPPVEECGNSLAVAPIEASPGGLACAVASLAEHQHVNGDCAASMAGSGASSFDMLRRSSSLPVGMARVVGKNPPGCWNEVSPACGREVRAEDGECSTDHWSEVADAGTSYAGSDVMVDAWAAAASFPEGVNMAANHLLPESYEEQMMLAMAVSLAEARARTNTQGLTWL